MQNEGPLLEELIDRLGETPEDFLADPLIGRTGSVHVVAVVGDLLRQLGETPRLGELSRFTSSHPQQDRNRLSVVLLLCWLLSADWFHRTKLSKDQLLQTLETTSDELSNQVASKKFIADPDRREELVRTTLARLGYRPAGETIAQAQDRLSTLSSAERARVMKAAQIAEERARQIREALARKAAEESADKWTRE